MASPLATESPSINRAWEAFVAHVPAILLAWIAAMGISVIGTVVYFVISALLTMLSGADPNGGGTVLAMVLGQLGQLPFMVLSSFVGVLLAAIPALYYERGEVITVQAAFAALFEKPWRYLWAGVLFTVLVLVGFLFCVLPGVLILFVTPLYVNRIFNTNLSVTDAFAASVQALFRSPQGIQYLGLELLTTLLVLVVSICTCGFGALLALPVSSFYLQNAAYSKGLISS
ncbi:MULTISPECIES: hypothetical protein [Synechococcaceae]|uniref:hypothetical protein n=1 Tax=Synechococcaceae TaxID=1890426 RepID=UPI001FFB9998|nr:MULTISPECIES: hypothetical protein [Synechococcaceae]UPH89535.1 hypothetical protein LY254_09575 [Synechococcus sp. NB0720_010]